MKIFNILRNCVSLVFLAVSLCIGIFSFIVLLIGGFICTDDVLNDVKIRYDSIIDKEKSDNQ